MSGPLLNNFEMFKSLFGQGEMLNVIIATSFWGRGFDTEGERREAEMKATFWADMLAQGCRVERFQNTFQSAWYVIGSLNRHWVHADNARRAKGVEQRTEEIKVRLSKSNNLKEAVGWLRSLFTPWRANTNSST